MAGFSGKGTQSYLGCAASKNPDQGITAIAAGFWKMLPVVIFYETPNHGLTAGVKTMGGNVDARTDVEGRLATENPRNEEKRVALVTGAASGLGRAIALARSRRMVCSCSGPAVHPAEPSVPPD